MSAHAATVPDDDLADTLEHEQQAWSTPKDAPARTKRRRPDTTLTRGMRWVLVIAAAVSAVTLTGGISSALSGDAAAVQQCVAVGGTYTKTATEVRCDGR